MDSSSDISQKPNFEALTRRGCEPKDPWLLAARYRVCSTPVHLSRPKSTPVSRVRRRRTVSCAGSEGGESNVTQMTASSDATLDSSKDLPEDYDYDDDEKPEVKTVRFASLSQRIYLDACRELSVTPATYFVKNLAMDTLIMRNHVLGPKGARACAVALTENAEVETLDMSGNGIGPGGAKYFADMLEDNYFIKELKLADNNLGSVGAKLITDALLLNSSIKIIDLSGNGFSESDACHFRTLLLMLLVEESRVPTLNHRPLSNTTLREVNLSHNSFREKGGEIFGDILAKNKKMKTLNLSWNHLRRRGAVAIGKGITCNHSMRFLNVSWNGFYLEGCRALAKALERNRTLMDLNLQANRINKECLEELIKGLKRNKTLTSLKLSDNPITTEGAMALLKSIREITSMSLIRLDLGEQCVEKEFPEVLLQIQLERPLEVKYGVVLRDEMPGQTSKEQALVSEDPILVLMEFMKLKNLRLIDLFQSLDKDGSHSLSNQEIKAGLLEEGMPLSEKCLNKLLSRLDRDKNGEIDFGELMVGQKTHRRRMNTIVEAPKDGDMTSKECDVVRVRARLKELINKKDKELFRRFHERKLASALAGERRFIFDTGSKTRKVVRPASTEPTLSTLSE